MKRESETLIQDIGGNMTRDTNAKLRGWMATNNMSGVAFAAEIDMPYDTFKVKMSGKSEWKFSEILKILKATACKFEEIF